MKERICSLWEQILSFKRSSHVEKGRNCRESLLDTVVSFRILATPLAFTSQKVLNVCIYKHGHLLGQKLYENENAHKPGCQIREPD